MSTHPTDFSDLTQLIKNWAKELGFQQLGISGIDAGKHAHWLEQWLAAGHQGEMDYMGAHGNKRSRPEELVPGTLRILSARMDYLPPDTQMSEVLADPQKAYISRYALGRDYHKVMRKRLQQLAERISHKVGKMGYRVFVDSAPVLEKAFAEQAGLGWIGKNTLLINRQAGSWFFLGEIFIDLPLPVDKLVSQSHCGRCQSCLKHCPTGALVSDYVLDARLCISYLTIEFKGSIPIALRPLMGNKIFGCDNCQIACPWNRFARPTQEQDFQVRHALDARNLLELFLWTEAEFLQHTEGSPIRRAGYERWQRNLAIALGNAPKNAEIHKALLSQHAQSTALVQEHIEWALEQHKIS